MPKYTLYAFGSNGEGQLGIGNNHDTPRPTRVPFTSSLSGTNLLRITGGANHTLIHLDHCGGTVYGAGSNQYGQLEPSRIDRLEKFRKLNQRITLCAAAQNSSAFISNGNTKPNGNGRAMLFGLGISEWGELGPVVAAPEAYHEYGGWEPKKLFRFPTNVIDFAAGAWHYVAVLQDGQIWGWGKGRNGQLGRGRPDENLIPSELDPVDFQPVRVVCGKEFTYLVGDPVTGSHAILGDRPTIRRGIPENVPGWKQIGASWNAVFVLFDDGRLIGFGKENLWELVPAGLPPIDNIAVGACHVLALTKAGNLLTWGWGEHGNCGLLDTERYPKNIVSGRWVELLPPPGNVQAIVTGASIGEISDEERGSLEGHTVLAVGAGASTSFVLLSEPSSAVGQAEGEARQDSRDDEEET
ncbi:regulator of chromosome condensation 1/beta-lactamase-inhibitor protein II [Clohesyomyces aquaticus]|uniref:Regulator of chromosome condensation 1/beta-lactamase-inhibitor protein II n=1 Tax=Clohesyomyces aquaticus TaxID=1231657 RepID=A0A1Y1ZJP9_9PLEO|nr:regulator of chromosome condensation 1/beta-lactamase-inhibitor protein II [Clohesyomyces aquaticus]